jgi:hypothetical protein
VLARVARRARAWIPLVGTAALLALIALVVRSTIGWHSTRQSGARCFSRVVAAPMASSKTAALATRGSPSSSSAPSCCVQASGLRSAWPWVGTWLLGLLTRDAQAPAHARRPGMLIAVGYSFRARRRNGVLA